MDEVHEESILLIGPPNVGKSEVARILSEKTNLPAISLADTREKYYSELKYDKEYAVKLKRTNGELSRYEYTKPFESHHVASFLNTINEKSIIKFEASQTVYEDNDLFMKVYDSVKKFANIILLLPDVDLQDSWQLINRVGKVPVNSDLSKLNWHLVSSPCNSNLATYTVCICGRTPDEISNEIIEYLNSKKNKNVKIAS